MTICTSKETSEVAYPVTFDKDKAEEWSDTLAPHLSDVTFDGTVTTGPSDRCLTVD